MLKFLLVRLLSAIPVLLGISLVSYIIIQMQPGYFASSFKVNLIDNGMDEVEAEAPAQARQGAVWSRPTDPVQYGPGSRYHQRRIRLLICLPARRRRADLRAPSAHAGLAMSAHLISTLIGVFVGIYAATHKYSLGDTGATVLAFLGTSIPRFFLPCCCSTGWRSASARSISPTSTRRKTRLRRGRGTSHGYAQPRLAGDRDRRCFAGG